MLVGAYKTSTLELAWWTNSGTRTLEPEPPECAPGAYTLPPTSSHTLPLTSSRTLPPTSSHTLPPTSSHTLPPTSSHTLPPTSSHTLPPTSSHTVPPTSSHTLPPTSSHTLPPTSSQDFLAAYRNQNEYFLGAIVTTRTGNGNAPLQVWLRSCCTSSPCLGAIVTTQTGRATGTHPFRCDCVAAVHLVLA